MYLDKEEKEKIFKNHGRLKKNNDTGSAESQIALFTYRIKHLTDHFVNRVFRPSALTIRQNDLYMNKNY